MNWRKYCPMGLLLCLWYDTQKPLWLWDNEFLGSWLTNIHYHLCPLFWEAAKDRRILAQSRTMDKTTVRRKNRVIAILKRELGEEFYYLWYEAIATEITGVLFERKGSK